MAGQETQIAEESLVVVYNRKNGQILHGHHFVTYKGGKHPDEKEREKQALEQCSLQQPLAPAGKMDVLHVPVSDAKPGLHYKVDPKKRVMIEDRKKRKKG